MLFHSYTKFSASRRAHVIPQNEFGCCLRIAGGWVLCRQQKQHPITRQLQGNHRPRNIYFAKVYFGNTTSLKCVLRHFSRHRSLDTVGVFGVNNYYRRDHMAVCERNRLHIPFENDSGRSAHCIVTPATGSATI